MIERPWRVCDTSLALDKIFIWCVRVEPVTPLRLPKAPMLRPAGPARTSTRSTVRRYSDPKAAKLEAAISRSSGSVSFIFIFLET